MDGGRILLVDANTDVQSMQVKLLNKLKLTSFHLPSNSLDLPSLGLWINVPFILLSGLSTASSS